MITILIPAERTTETLQYVQDDRTWWERKFGGEKARREKVRILTMHGRVYLSDLILRSSEPLAIGHKFDYLDGTVLYRGVLPIERNSNSIYRCMVDQIIEREKRYLTSESGSHINTPL